MAVPYEEYNQQLLLIQAYIQLVVVGIFLIIDAIVWKKYKQKRIRGVLLIGIAFLLMGIGILAGTIPQLLCLYAREVDLIYGIPIGGGHHLWWTNVSMICIVLSNLCILQFAQQLFQKPTNKTFLFFTSCTLIFIIWDIYEGIFLYEPGGSAMSVPLSALLLLLIFYTWGSFFLFARRDAKKLEELLYKRGMQLIAVSAILMIFSFISWTLTVLMPSFRVFGIIYWIFYTLTVFLLYLGYILPAWFRKILEGNESGIDDKVKS